MLRKLQSSSKTGSVGGHQSTYCANSKYGGLVVVGLQSLLQYPETKSNVVLKSTLGAYKSCPARTIENSCYLKSCHLCKKNFSPDKDIYMYRGDQGFCTVKCRDRQIVLDEMKELEVSTKQMPKFKRHYNSAGRRETRLLSEDLRRRNKLPIPRVIFHRQIVS